MPIHGLLLVLQALVPPAGSKVILRAHAQGDQIYTCQQNAYTFSWGLKAPDARLLDDSNHVIGRHFAGPTWGLNDGSQITARPIAKQDAPEANAVPWLQLQVVSATGHGLLEHAKVVQRVQTHGGQPPASGCDQMHLGAELRVPYTAEYDFYGS